MKGSQITKKQYILTTFGILSNEGVEAISIRRLGKELNCNLANLYRYFRSVDELIIYASLRYLSGYLAEVQECCRQIHDSLEVHLAIWDRFARYSFTWPEVFNTIFFGKYSKDLDAILKDYYALFPDDMGTLGQREKELFATGDFNYRNYFFVAECIKDGYFTEEDGKTFSMVSVYLYKGFLKELLDNKARNVDVDVEEYTALLLACLQNLAAKYQIR